MKTIVKVSYAKLQAGLPAIVIAHPDGRVEWTRRALLGYAAVVQEGNQVWVESTEPVFPAEDKGQS